MSPDTRSAQTTGSPQARSKATDLSAADKSRIIEMAWEDRTPFEAIERNYGLQEKQVIRFMRRELKPSSFRLWRQRVTGRRTKHGQKRPSGVLRGYAYGQYKPR